jgi:hypothetical protein
MIILTQNYKCCCGNEVLSGFTHFSAMEKDALLTKVRAELLKKIARSGLKPHWKGSQLEQNTG